MKTEFDGAKKFVAKRKITEPSVKIEDNLVNVPYHFQMSEEKQIALAMLEEKLGIDLITLFKALKQDTPIWYRTPKYDDKNESVKKSGNAMLGFTTKNEPYITIDTYAFDLKDYGITWALTKEELE